MAFVAILIGSVLGFFAGLIGFLFFGLPLVTAIALYLICGVGMGALTASYTVIRCILMTRTHFSPA
ncbi:MAG: hypothetical protein ACRBB0_03720 [Pelagimonas sp.]|uniref:hypothetical protein n=1 Tax=Pelagimonas sp. TaxID=2073170 RepID=UPI003D6A5AB5